MLEGTLYDALPHGFHEERAGAGASTALPELDAKAGLGLAWPPWEAPGSEERARDAGTLGALTGAGLMSRESAVGLVAAEYGLADAQAELRRIAGEQGGVAQAQARSQFVERLARLRPGTCEP